jgi:hypothetical protein
VTDETIKARAVDLQASGTQVGEWIDIKEAVHLLLRLQHGDGLAALAAAPEWQLPAIVGAPKLISTLYRVHNNAQGQIHRWLRLGSVDLLGDHAIGAKVIPLRR